ncbi:S24 family peptidase [Kingella kingae]|uniref:helix-turn-helix domain-containing protein n=1 Tax=Kingella kingae TaxID=504 RepID=UPI00254F6118|nr:S24 family peptidase [Kingella kingae]MDK4650069.1 S24 family peptidase [Kingella kingae]
MNAQKEWFLTKELTDIGGLPSTPRGVLKKALAENWKKRQKDGVRGKVYEFHYTSFPTEVLVELGLPKDKKNDDLQSIETRLSLLGLPENQLNEFKSQLGKTATLLKIQEITQCDLNWLATGEGKPFPQAPKIQVATTPEMDEQAALQSSLNKTAQFIAQQQAAKRKAKLVMQRANGLCDTQGNPVDIDDFVFIPYYNVQLSAGHGSWVDNEQPTHSLAFRRDWLQMFVSSQIEHLSVVKVRGDSMRGVLENDDTILVDHTQITPTDDIYAIRLGDEVFVKRIQRLPNKLRVVSVNPDYEPFEIDLSDDNSNFAIIGKVVWLGRVL